MVETANYFEESGYETIMVVPEPESREGLSLLSKKSKSQIEYYPIKRPHRPLSLMGTASYIIKAFWSILRLFILIRQKDVEVVHVNELFDIPGLIAGKLAGTKTICHTRVIIERPIWLRRLLLKSVASFADKIICVSKAVRQKMFGGIDSNKIETIYNPGPDRENFSPEQYSSGGKRNGLGLKKDHFIVGLVSKFTENKGQINLVKAAKMIDNEGIDDIRYIFVGGKVSGHEEYYQKVVELTREKGLSNKIIFTGYRKDVPAIVNVCDVMVHIPIHHDPFPGVVLEAMAMEKPIIASDSGGVSEEFEDGKSGILIPRNDPSSLAKKILLLYKDEARRKKIGNYAREFLNANFTWGKYLSQLEEVYNDLI